RSTIRARSCPACRSPPTRGCTPGSESSAGGHGARAVRSAAKPHSIACWMGGLLGFVGMMPIDRPCVEHAGVRRMARLCVASAALAILTTVSSFAQEAAPKSATAPVVGAAALPRDLSPWGMFQSADVIVKGVLMALALASIVTWTIWLAKTLEIV